MPEDQKNETRERINAKLYERKLRVKSLAHRVMMMRLDSDELALLECHALELRSLAYQIRALRVARVALDAVE